MPSFCTCFGSKKDNDHQQENTIPVKVVSHTNPVASATPKALSGGKFKDPVWEPPKPAAVQSDPIESAPVSDEKALGTNTVQQTAPQDWGQESPRAVPAPPTSEPASALLPVEKEGQVGNEKPIEQQTTDEKEGKVESEKPIERETTDEKEEPVESEKPIDKEITDGKETPIEATHLAQPNTNDEMTDQLKGAASGLGNTVSGGAEKASSGVQSAASNASNTATGSSSGTQDWNAMSEDQKKQTFDSLPSDQKKDLTYTEWVKQGYHNQKENWMPWIEDVYLRWFSKDNKASYATKSTLDKSKVTGVEQVDTLQDSVNSTVSSQVGQGGLLQPVGDMASKEGVNRAERGGKDESGGSYAGAIGGYASSAGSGLMSGAKSAGGYVGGMFGGSKEGEESK